jgi:hypothetical protein
MESTQKQNITNSNDSERNSIISLVEQVESSERNNDNIELNDEQLEAAAGGVYIIPIFHIPTTTGGEDGSVGTRPS